MNFTIAQMCVRIEKAVSLKYPVTMAHGYLRKYYVSSLKQGTLIAIFFSKGQRPILYALKSNKKRGSGRRGADRDCRAGMMWLGS